MMYYNLNYVAKKDFIISVLPTVTDRVVFHDVDTSM